MSEISETQRNLNELMNEYEVAVIGENRGRNLSRYSEKVDKYYQKRRELKEFVAELEAGGVQIQYMSEDELPKPISYKVYSAMFRCSKVDFVRLFPYVTIDGRKLFLIELPEREE